MSTDPLWLLQVAFAALGDVAFACAVGAVLLRTWLGGEQAYAPVSPARAGWRRASRTGAASAIVFVACSFASLWLQTAAMSGLPILDAGASLWLVATATHAGIGWAVACAGGVVLAVASGASGSLGAARVAAAVLGAIVAAAGKAAIGHAADAGAFSLAEGVQTLHLLATGVWGGVVIAGAVVLPAADTSAARASLMRLVVRLSHAATIAVALVIATGVFNAWRGTGGSADVLTGSGWGRALLVKSALIAGALALGALNRWSALPRLQRTASTTDAHTVINVMRVEAVLMVLVFVAASVLSHSVPGFAN
ncbi:MULTISPECIES: CopD family protein [unclassified Caballeronia]|uniref:CopD family protein n=1 Tax=unclassified Caballeronia TaxID=2646786 RepID=UPI0028634045|nr:MULTISPECIES: CopD family protein [unclassified Caballeronia]MDR5736616.1 CopD family protein [Caballeronia sp. LZ016]MDR5810904.1 CopD family protein [Caballeronia sp. LZ019]